MEFNKLTEESYRMLKRRHFLKKTAQVTSASLLPIHMFSPLSQLLPHGLETAGTSLSKNPKKKHDKKRESPVLLNLYNTHTGEWLKNFCFQKDGDWIKENLNKVNYFFRDHRNNMVHPIEKSLLIILQKLKCAINLSPHHVFHIVSGFRSPQTNAALHATRLGVAKDSQHLYGRAADIFIPHISMATLSKAARSLRLGGVGCYRNFVHLDCHKIRSW